MFPIITPEIIYNCNVKLSGIVRIKLSPLTQKIIGCVIGENLTEEYPWIEINKQIIQDNIYLHPDSSDFLLVAHEIFSYPYDTILIGYDPQKKQDAQFLICVTEEARNYVLNQIHAIRLKRENKVINSINKKPNPWKHLGSAEEIDSTFEGTRNLIRNEYEIKIKFPWREMNFSFRTSTDQRDSYIEIIPTQTEIYENINKSVIDIGIQSIPAVCENETQTKIAIPADFSSQYLLSDLPIYNVTEKEFKNDMSTVLIKLKYMELLLSKENRSWDLHTNDFQKLIHEK